MHIARNLIMLLWIGLSLAAFQKDLQHGWYGLTAMYYEHDFQEGMSCEESI